MSYNAVREQIRIDDSRQVLRPGDLGVGMEIGLLSVIQPVSRPMRALQAASALILQYGSEVDEKRVASARRAWNFTGPSGLLPVWRGTVHSVMSEAGIWVNVSASSLDEEVAPFEYLNRGLDALPDMQETVRLHSSYDNLGLVPFAVNTRTIGAIPGHWASNVTIRLS